MLTFNTRSLLKIDRRMIFANSINSKNLDVLCLTETWLTTDIPNKALFMPKYQIYRKDRPSFTHKTKHGGVLIAVNCDISHEPIPNYDHSDQVVVILRSPYQSILLCCMYNAPSNSPYRWVIEDLFAFLCFVQTRGKGTFAHDRGNVYKKWMLDNNCSDSKILI